MDLNAHHLAWLRLSLTPGLSNAAIRALVKAFGPPGAVLATDGALIEAQLGPAIATALAAGPRADTIDRARAWLADPRHWLVGWRDPEFPTLLGETADPPPVLYGIGRPSLLGAPSLAIVGSRNATAQGRRDAEELARFLSDEGLTIVSGLALGIDAAAHRGGLAGASSSVAVLGTGADIAYPRRNRDLFERLASEGAIVSEFPLGTPPSRDHFPRRNRVISGLSKGTLVVEAVLASGSLITARCAGEQGRDVLAVPGSIHAPHSRGTHALIRDGATLVECGDDVLFALGIASHARQRRFASWTRGEDAILDALGPGSATMEELAHRTGSAISDVSARIAELELAGCVAVLPGSRVQRLHGPDADTL